MSKILGHSGVITIAGFGSGVTSFTLTKDAENPETTVMGATTKTFMGGIKSFTLDAESLNNAAIALAESYTVADTLKSFEINGTAEALEVTAIGDVDAEGVPYRSFVGGLPGWEATLEIDMNAGTPPPSSGAAYSFAGVDAVVQSCSVTGEVGGIISYSLAIKGTDTLPAAISPTPGGSAAFSVLAGDDYVASGDIVITSCKVSGTIGGVVTYSISGQGTGELIETDPEA